MQRRGPGPGRPRSARPSPLSRSLAGAAVVAAIVLSSCSPSAAPSPSAGAPSDSTEAGTPSPTLSPVPTDPGTSPGATPPGQTNTDWGRIWDAVPPGFPVYPGAHPTETGAGPASAILDAGAAKPAEVVTFYQTAMTGIGLNIVSNDGPREDGSFDLLAGDGASCAVEITVAPQGTSTIVTILYAAGCAFP
jgi:hypothetical protein